MRERDASIDIVRTIGIVAIVAGHVWDSPALKDVLFSWHVPVFFFLSGYLWRPGRSVRDEVVNRSRTLLKPYVFWLAVILVLFIGLMLIRGRFDAERLVGPVYGGSAATTPFTTFWFVFALFSSAVLWRALERTPIWVRAVVVALGVGASVFVGQVLASTPLAIGTALPAIVFLAAGQLLRHARLRPAQELLLAGGSLVVSAVLIGSGVSRPFDIKSGDWGTPVVSTIVGIAISWALVLLAKAVAPLLVSAGKWFTRFALTGFTIVLVHPVVIWLAPQAAPDWVVFIAAILIPLAIGAIALRTPGSQWVTGIPQRAIRSARTAGRGQ